MDEFAKPMDIKVVQERSAIEAQFPRIAEVLCELWGKEDYAPYLLSLVFDERGGRQGFPPEVSSALFMLHGLLEFQAAGDMWTQSDNRI